jgi:oligopeptide transport system substrate-binding protein
VNGRHWFGSLTPPHGQVFRFTLGTEPEMRDPGLMSGQPDGRFAWLVFEGLTTADPRTLEPRPGQAYAWDVSADGLVYTFHLRRGLVWSDGTPLGARDFLWSWRRVLDPTSGARNASLLFPIRGAEAFNRGDTHDVNTLGLEARDDTTFIVTLERPTAWFLSLTSFYAFMPVPRHVVERHGVRWTLPGEPRRQRSVPLDGLAAERSLRVRAVRTLLGSGRGAPRARDLLHRRRHEHVHEPVSLRRDRLEPERLHPVAVAAVHASVRRLPHRALSGHVLLQLQCHASPVRRPVGAPARSSPRWIARPSVATCSRAVASPGVASRPRAIPVTSARARCATTRRSARDCLARAGYPGGRGFPRVTLLFNTSEDNRRIGEALQAMWWRTLGIRVELSNQEWGSFLHATTTLDYDLARRSWIGDYLDPTTFLQLLTTNDGNNRTGFSNARYDALLAEASRTLEPARRFAVLAEAESLALDRGGVPAGLPLLHDRAGEAVGAWHVSDPSGPASAQERLDRSRLARP